MFIAFCSEMGLSLLLNGQYDRAWFNEVEHTLDLCRSRPYLRLEREPTAVEEQQALCTKVSREVKAHRTRRRPAVLNRFGIANLPQPSFSSDSSCPCVLYACLVFRGHSQPSVASMKVRKRIHELNDKLERVRGLTLSARVSVRQGCRKAIDDLEAEGRLPQS